MSLNTLLSEDEYTRGSCVEQIMALAERFCTVANKNGYDIIPYTEKSMINLKQVEKNKLLEIHNNLLSYYQLVGGALDQGKKISDSKSILWALLKEMNLRPTSDIFDKIEKDDIVEAYGTDFKQIFRNLRFFDFCSYSLTDIFMYEWRDLFERDQRIALQLAEVAMNVTLGKTKGTTTLGVDAHLMQETFSEGRNKFNVTHKYLSPLYDKGSNIVAFIAISEAEILSSKRKSKLTAPLRLADDHEAQL